MEDEELDRVFFGADEVVCLVADPPVFEAVGPDPDVTAESEPPVAVLAPPEITPVYVAFHADTAAITLEGSGAIVPPLYWLHPEVCSSSLLTKSRSYAS